MSRRDSPPAPPAAAGEARGAQTAAAGPGADRAGQPWMPVVPGLVMLLLGLWRVSGASYWRDEAATLAAVRRPAGQLVAMLGHVDAVHGLYYLLMWPLVRLAGPGELVTRLPSVVAMAVAAGLVAALGARLVSPAAGLAAGLIFAVLPKVSLYAQDARSYAMVTALAVAASYLLAAAIGAARGGRRWRGWLAGYAACLAAASALNIFALLLIAAHAVTVAVTCLRRQPGDGPDAPHPLAPLAAGWLATATAVVVLVSPILALAYSQRSTASWITAPAPVTFVTWWRLIGPAGLVLAICVICGGGLAASALAGRAQLRASWPPLLTALALPWLLGPAAILIFVSFARPLFVPRYVLYCLPAVALLAGTGLTAAGRAAAAWLPRAWSPRPGLAAAGWTAGTAVLVAIALLGLHAQIRQRGPGGHSENIRRVDRIVAANLRPGDAVLYETSASIWAAYPYGLARLPDIARYQAPGRSGTLDGTDLPPAVVRVRITGVSRLWVVQLRRQKPVPQLTGLGLRLAGHWRATGLRLLLYERPG